MKRFRLLLPLILLIIFWIVFSVCFIISGHGNDDSFITIVEYILLGISVLTMMIFALFDDYSFSESLVMLLLYNLLNYFLYNPLSRYYCESCRETIIYSEFKLVYIFFVVSSIVYLVVIILKKFLLKNRK